jgi:hypothetical protein
MKRRGVVFTPEAEQQLAELYRYIEENASPEVALRYTSAVIEYCLGLEASMAFTLSDVVPWGRTFDEYRAMFALSDDDLAKRILGCGDGPAAFNAVATEKGYQVLSADPLYQFSAEEIEARIQQTALTVAGQMRRSAGEFVWSHFRSVDELIAARMLAMSRFLADYSQGTAEGRYVVACLPELPFADKAFELGARPSRHLPTVMDAFASAGLDVTLVPVPYEFQKGGNQMLRVSAHSG